MMVEPAPNADAAATACYRFHQFELVPSARSLSRDGWPVRLSSRAFDVLVYLVENAGVPVSKEQLIAHVWPSTIVEEVNLRVQMSTLRKALDEGAQGVRYIESMPGKGYCFIAPVHINVLEPASSLAVHSADQMRQKASWMTSWARPALGRGAVIAELVHDLPQRRLSTIIGPAGVGKTVVAREVVGRLAAEFRLRACLIDLATVDQACPLAQAVAAALGFSYNYAEGIGPLLDELRRCRTILLFDSCECRVQDVIVLLAQLLLLLPELWMLTTSREPLLALGESVLRLPALALPARAARLSAVEALEFPAIRLFCERARARCSDFVLRDRDVNTLVELCCRLDGLPLAIELAAARTELFTIDEILDQMDYRFHLLADGRRTGLQRHRTMWDALEWSFGRLGAQEQIVLRRLSVFQRGFNLDGAIDAAHCVFVPRSCIPALVDSLVAKSLMVTDEGIGGRSYRLLNSTRTYAHEKLLASRDEERFPARWGPR